MADGGWKNEVSYKKFVYDFAVDGGAVGAISLSSKTGSAFTLPLNALVKSVLAKVVTTCTSGGAATVAIGNTATPDAYMAATAVASLVANYVGTEQGTPNSVGAANEQDLTLTIATAALTAGKIEVHVEYYNEGL